MIGNGTPTVVQIHDPQCSQCRRLKDNVRAASRGLQDQAAHMTLLIFDERGKRVRTVTGVTRVETLRRLFSTLGARGQERGKPP